MSRLYVLLFVVIVLAVQSNAKAVTITNVTTNTTIFYDDFEGVSPVSNIPAVDGSGDYDPVAITGTWGVFEDPSAAIIQVTDSTTAPDPGPFQGNNYLRIYRDADLGGNEIYANVSAAPSNGDVIRLDLMVYLGTDDRARGGIFLEGTAGDANTARVLVFPDPASGTVHGRGAGFAEYDTGVPYTAGQWQRWSLEYTIGDSTYGLSVAGASASGLETVTAGNVGNARLFNGNVPAGSVYFDTVPEPCAFILIGIGSIGLLVSFQRRMRI